MADPSLVMVGKVGSAHGVHGAVKIIARGESFQSLGRGAKLYWKPEGAGSAVRELTIEAIQLHGRMWLVQFEEIKDRGAARSIAGLEIFLPESGLPPLEDGEYYYYQLIGLSVEKMDGTPVGAIAGIIETGSHDVYVVRDREREFLIPAVDEVIREVDLAGRRVVIDPPEGLLE
ncbi:MAG: ribosome maturation factor RimM [Syntrophobacteraceae bacterium]|jgi:16S rRNA processing protein RimM|nr:ribosome maturation factor RimM [Syntrophobacteraceae bacterium]